jgi:phosphopantetheinyl transferase
MDRDRIADQIPADSGPGRRGPVEVLVWRVDVGDDAPKDAARVALGAILADQLGASGPPPLALDGHGKPQLADAPERLSFNLSHSGGLALVAIAPGGVEVGVDVEQLRPRRDLVRLAERWLPAVDAAGVAAAEGVAERQRMFYASWTRLEARVKCTGTGIAGPSPGPEVVVSELTIDPGYAAAVAIDTSTVGVDEPHFAVRNWNSQI